jgi:hypothetical protein
LNQAYIYFTNERSVDRKKLNETVRPRSHHVAVNIPCVHRITTGKSKLLIEVPGRTLWHPFKAVRAVVEQPFSIFEHLLNAGLKLAAISLQLHWSRAYLSSLTQALSHNMHHLSIIEDRKRDEEEAEKKIQNANLWFL